ncbi:aromatic ring-hydroxylating dioxygenase subunit alpha [Novosphingobium pentaromativorans]|uniref:Rieske domain-containing protein n=1 Tax=Novosphingobium pentaromativorans US6-1 TaxID=1088721 RepID=G6EGI9_9SPHN|nr:aromatic ring-hydroxylating dioxygenase subunit alpha [Novosphingobium pentaromativorans]EHJ59536.1 hypothetical protein NSU_3419 [Novosphingobium pentaromativorans US6-1]
MAAWSSELVGEAMMPREVLGEPIVLYRAADGSIVCMEDRCCHRLAPLSLGERDGDAVRCLYHGFKFARDGACVEIPGQKTIPRSACVQTYPATEKGGWIWVWMGDPARANLDLVPPAIGPGDEGWLTDQSHLDYDADYQLINDNLTDFSHLSYVHRNSFGATEFFADTRPKVTRLDRGIRIQRWMTSDTSKVMETAETHDRFQTYDYLVPGILLMRTTSYPAGAAQASGHDEPAEDLPKLIEVFSSQALTPIGAQKTRYYFSNSVNEAPGNEHALAGLMAMTFAAFAEDKAMIEGQQRIINADPTRKERLFGHDSGPVQMRRVIAELIEAEQ